MQKASRDADLANPCSKESKMVLGCLEKNNYDKKSCTEYQRNYQSCKQFWRQVYKDRKINGLTPYMPIGEDQDKIKAEYMRNKRQSS